MSKKRKVRPTVYVVLVVAVAVTTQGFASILMHIDVQGIVAYVLGFLLTLLLYATASVYGDRS